jgi:sulfur carrier protein ThiS
MNWWLWLLWILGVVGLLYLAGFFICLGSLLNFRSRLRKRTRALSVLFAEKKDILLSMYALFVKANIPLQPADKDEATKVRWVLTDVKQSSDTLAVNATLSSFEKHLSYLAQGQEIIEKDAHYLDSFSALQDLDMNYRRIAAVYNSDLVGYDYWRKHPLYGFWFWVDGFKEQKRLS